MPPDSGAGGYVVLALMAFVSGAIGGLAGTGFAQAMVAGLALILEPKTAVALLSIMVPITSAQQVWRYRAQVALVRRFAGLWVACLVGVPIGVLILTVLPASTMALLLGIFTVTFVVTNFRKVRFRVRPEQERLASALVGVTAGISSGAVGASGPILASYLLALHLSPPAFAFAAAVLFLSMAVLRGLGLAATGEMTPWIVATGLALTLPALLGQRAAFWIRDRASHHLLQRLVLAILFTAGLSLLRRGLLG